MSTEQRLVSDLNIIPDGNPLPVESGSGRLTNWPRYTREGSASTVGKDAYTETKRVPTITANIQFTEGFDVSRLEGLVGVPVTGKQGSKRFTAHDCSLADVQEIGGGGVGITILILGPVQWL